MGRKRISDLERHLDGAYRALNKLIALSRNYQILLCTDWERFATNSGKSTSHALWLFIEEVSENRLEASSAQRDFCFDYESLMKHLKGHDRCEEIRGKFPSTIGLFDPNKHRLNATGFPNTVRRAREDIEQSIHALNYDFVRWIHEVVRESPSGLVDPMKYVPDATLFDVNHLIQQFLFDDLVTTGEYRMYFFNEIFDLVRQGMQGGEIIQPRYEATRQPPSHTAIH